MTSSRLLASLVAIIPIVVAFASAPLAQAQLALTAEGISRGFHLTTFVSNFPNADNGFGTAGAFGDLFTSSGLLVSDGTVYSLSIQSLTPLTNSFPISS